MYDLITPGVNLMRYIQYKTKLILRQTEAYKTWNYNNYLKLLLAIANLKQSLIL